jgi:hypothetical protein
MATIAVHGTLSASDHSAQLRKAVIASTIGTTIEWYDFFLYGTAAGLIFGKLYFPNQDPLTATLAAFGTYFIGFVEAILLWDEGSLQTYWLDGRRSAPVAGNP